MKYLLLFLITINAYAFDQKHSKWDSILKTYTSKVDDQVLFKYSALKNNVQVLDSYLSDLESLTKEDFKQFSKDEQLAFWINAYNAYTVKIIIKNYPVKSIKDIGSIFSSTWSKDFIKLFKKDMSLDDIEHETIRKTFKEPRIHFAVNCASISCPSLLQSAFVGKTINIQLDKAAKHFLNNKLKNYHDKKGSVLYLSAIFKWYGADFNAKYDGYLNYITEELNLPKGLTVEWLDYDWSLNELK
jgi:hypothetical protein